MISIVSILILLLSPFGRCYEDEFVKNYLQIQKSPRVVVFSCWNTRAASNLAQLSKQYPMSLQINNWTINKNLFSAETFIITDSKCSQFRDLLQNANRLNLFKTRIKWLVLNFDNKTRLAGNLNILIDSQFAIATPIGDNKLELSLVYKIRKDHDGFVRNFVGVFSINENRFVNFNRFTFAANRTNLQESLFKVSFVLTRNDSVNHLDDYRDKHIDSITKISLKLLQPMLDQLNVTKTFILHNTWGVINETTKIPRHGIFGDLYNDKSDFSGTSSLILLQRLEFFECVHMYGPNNVKFIFRAPPLSYVKNIATLPFQSEVWYCCYSFLFVFLFGLFLIISWEIKSRVYNKEVGDTTNLLNHNRINLRLSDVCLLQIGALSQQGIEIEPKSYSGRIITFTLLLTLMFLYTAYSAHIVALLQSTSDSIKTVEDLYESRIRVGAEDVVFNHYLLTTPQETVHQALYHKKLAPNGNNENFLKLEDGIRRVQTEFFAFHSDVSPCYEIIKRTFEEHEKCSLQEIDFVQIQSQPCFLIKKNSPYKEILDIAADRVTESGLRSREIERLYNGKPRCIGQISSFTSVGLQDGYFAFLLFGFGIGLSLIVLMLELISAKFLRKIDKIPSNLLKKRRQLRYKKQIKPNYCNFYYK